MGSACYIMKSSGHMHEHMHLERANRPAAIPANAVQEQGAQRHPAAGTSMRGARRRGKERRSVEQRGGGERRTLSECLIRIQQRQWLSLQQTPSRRQAVYRRMRTRPHTQTSLAMPSASSTSWSSAFFLIVSSDGNASSVSGCFATAVFAPQLPILFSPSPSAGGGVGNRKGNQGSEHEGYLYRRQFPVIRIV